MHERRPVEIDMIRSPDGRLYERTITHQPQVSIPQSRHDMTQTYVSSQPLSPRHAPLHEGYDPRAQAINSRVLPSIEDDQLASPGQSRSRVPQHDSRMAPPRLLQDEVQSNARSRNVQVIDLTDGADTQIAKRRRVEEPLGSRRIVDSNGPRRSFDQLGPQDGFDRPAREPQYHEREIIDPLTPTYIRDPFPASSRGLAASRQMNSRMDGQGIRSDSRAFRPLVEVQQNVAATRYAHAAEPARDQIPVSGFQPQRVQYEGKVPYGNERRYVQPADENHHLHNRSIRSEHDVPRYAARPPIYDGGNISYSREYIPVIRNEVLLPGPAAHQHLPIYADPGRGPQQHDRYDFRRNRCQVLLTGRLLPFTLRS